MSFKKWTPSKTAKKDFAETMEKIRTFCKNNDILASLSADSFYFTLNGKNYRVSNHTIENSNRHAYDETTGEQIRELYHPDGREPGTVYITASKTRIIEIYNDLKNGYTLDSRGNRKQ